MADWNIIVPILSGLATLAVTIFTIIKAVSVAPQEARTSDAGIAKSYAEAAQAAAEQCHELYERLRESQKIIDELRDEMNKRKEATQRRDETIAFMQRKIGEMEGQIQTLRTENDELRLQIAALEEENRELKSKIDGGQT